MAADAIKGFLISGTPHYIDAKYVNGTEITSGMVNSLATLKGIYVNTSNNFEVNAAVAGGEKLNLVAAQAVQIKPGIDENGKPEAVQFDCEQHGAEATEFTFKVCNGAQPKATRVVGLKVNAAELTLDNQKCNTTEFDADSIDIKVRNDKWNSGEVVGTTGPVYLKMKARAMDFRCYDHGGIALQVAGHDGSGKENKIKFESDRTSEIGATAAYCKEGGKGLEFGTFNNLHTSLYTGDYRFKGDADVYGVTRNTPVATSTGKVDYPTQADDFKDVITTGTPRASWNEIIDAANKCKVLDETIAAAIASAQLSGSEVDTSVFVTKTEVGGIVASAMSEMSLDNYYTIEQTDAKVGAVSAATSFVNGVVFRKDNGNIEVSAEGKLKTEGQAWSAETFDETTSAMVVTSGVTYDPASLDLVSEGKVAVKAASDFEFGAKDIVFPIEVSKKNKYSCGKYEVSGLTSLAGLEAVLPKLTLRVEKQNSTIGEISAAFPVGEMSVSVYDLINLVSRVNALEARIAALEGSMVSGVTGVQGPMGPNGVDGAQGPQGNDGMNGSGQGVQGPMGPTGADGLTGADGAQGPQGEAGENGESGMTLGVQGPMGPAGENGLDGTQGPQGVAGENGESGTTFGVQGPMGPAGADGAQGVAGENGADGEQGPQGTGIANIYSEPNSAFGGTIYVITTDGLAAGFEYSNGAQGAQGVAGENGVDGNDGPQGPQGPVGADGAQGVAGENGADGNDGPQGPQGPDGIQGPQGAQNA